MAGRVESPRAWPAHRLGRAGFRRACGGRRAGHHLAEHAGELIGHLVGRLKTQVRIALRGLEQEAVQRFVPGEHLLLGGRRQVEFVDALKAEFHQAARPACGRSCTGPRPRSAPRPLPAPVAARAVDVAARIVQPAHAAHVDQLDVRRRAFEHEVVGLHVAIDHAGGVQVGERAEDAMHVGDGLGGRQRTALLAERLDRRAVDVLHHDEAFGPALDEVVDADDVGVLHGRQELAFGHGGGRGRFVGRVQQPLEHHPAIEHGVLGQVDPAQSAVGQAALDLVLVGDDVARLERRDERIGLSAGRTEPRFAAGQGRGIALGVVAIRVPAEPLVRRHLRVRHDDLFRIASGGSSGTATSPSPRCFRELDRALPVLPPRRPGPQTRGTRQRCRSRTADRGRARTADQARAAAQHGGTGIGRFQAATIAEAALDRAAATGLRAFCPSIKPLLRVVVVDSRPPRVATAPAAWGGRRATRWLRSFDFGQRRIFGAAVGHGLGLQRAEQPAQIAPLVEQRFGGALGFAICGQILPCRRIPALDAHAHRLPASGGDFRLEFGQPGFERGDPLIVGRARRRRAAPKRTFSWHSATVSAAWRCDWPTSAEQPPRGDEIVGHAMALRGKLFDARCEWPRFPQPGPGCRCAAVRGSVSNSCRSAASRCACRGDFLGKAAVLGGQPGKSRPRNR